MKNCRKIAPIAIVCVMMVLYSGCGLSKLVNLVNCKFSMANVSDVTWAGINLSNIKNVSDLSVTMLQKAATALKNKDFNVSANVNVNVANESQKVAQICAFDYELFLEDQMLAQGSNNNNKIVINPHTTTKVPVPISVNIVQIIKNGQVGDVVNFAKNLMDYGNGKESKVKVKVTPYASIKDKRVKLAPISLNKTFQ